MGTANVEITATFTDEPTTTYTVTFDTDGGSSIAPQTVVEGETATQPAAPTKDGYDFLGWFTDDTYEETFDFSTPIMEDTTIYAEWEEETPPGLSFDLDLPDEVAQHPFNWDPSNSDDLGTFDISPVITGTANEQLDDIIAAIEDDEEIDDIHLTQGSDGWSCYVVSYTSGTLTLQTDTQDTLTIKTFDNDTVKVYWIDTDNTTVSLSYGEDPLDGAYETMVLSDYIDGMNIPQYYMETPNVFDNKTIGLVQDNNVMFTHLTSVTVTLDTSTHDGSMVLADGNNSLTLEIAGTAGADPGAMFYEVTNHTKQGFDDLNE